MGDARDFSSILLTDWTASIRKLKSDQPSDFRACIRAGFAAVEGHLSGLCEELLARATSGLSEPERMALSEKTFRVDDNGDIKVVKAHLPLKHRVKLATKIVHKIHPEYAIDFGGAGWRELQEGLEVRDRLTHPKSPSDMAVSEKELEAAINGIFWFLGHVIAPGHESIAAYLEKTEKELKGNALRYAAMIVK
jgi:hypothetical protein